MKGKLLGSIAMALVMLAASPVLAAGDNAAVETQLKDLQAQIDKLQNQLNEKQYGQMHKEEMARLMKDIMQDAEAAPALPAWMKNLTYFGDFRLRYQHDSQAGSTGNPNAEVSPKDMNRLRFRLRFGVKKTWWDEQLQVVFRLASWGDGWNSSNETFDGWFTKKAIGIDLAYAKYAPKWLKGFAVTGGKFSNPIRTKTAMTHDDDITWEGIYAEYVAPFCGEAFQPYAAVGFWSLEDQTVLAQVDGDGNRTIYSQTIWTYELGYNWKLAQDISHFLGITYYDYDHYNANHTGAVNGPAGIDGNWTKNGRNDADFGIVELTTSLKWKLFDLPWQGTFSWIHNARDDFQDTDSAADNDFEDMENGYLVSLKVGQNKKKGDWSASYTYAYVEPHATTEIRDSDLFGVATGNVVAPLGPFYGNVKGSVLGATYNIDDFLTLGAKVFFAELVNSGIGAGGNHDLDSNTTVQVDLVWKF